MKQKRLSLLVILVLFLMAFLAQKLTYTINIRLDFVFGPIFEQDHLLNLIILGAFGKRQPKCALI